MAKKNSGPKGGPVTSKIDLMDSERQKCFDVLQKLKNAISMINGVRNNKEAKRDIIGESRYAIKSGRTN